MAQDPQKIDVVLSGSTSTQVVTPTSANTINLNQAQNTVNVSQTSATSSVSTTPASHINVGFLGIQGVPGTSTTAPPQSLDGEILYNRDGWVSGARSFFYYPNANKLQISGNNLLLSHGSTLTLSGSAPSENAFLVRDSNSKNLLKVDTENSGITIAEDAEINEYKVGIGNANPQERVHISNGNLRLDGDMLISGSILPLKSGEYDLGSMDYPFRELFLQGDSIVFVDKDAKITASSTGFSFQVTNAQGQTKEIASISTGNVGIFRGDGAVLTGVPYTGLKDAGVFLQKAVPDQAGSITVDYFDEINKTLNYDPSVICSLNPPNNTSGYYFTTVDNITRSSCRANFSQNVSGAGFVLNCHVSPRNPVL